MVEHRVSGSRLGAFALPCGWRWTSSEDPKTGASLWCRGSEQSPPDDILIRGRRGGMALWALGENPTSLP